MIHRFVAICALSLCNCTLSFDLDSLQAGADTASGSHVPQPSLPGSVVPGSPQSSDSGADPADGWAAANSEAAVPGPLGVDAVAIGVTVDEGGSGHTATINDATVLTQAQPVSDAAIESAANAQAGIESGSPEDGSNGVSVLPATDGATSDQASVASDADAGSWCAQNTTSYTAYCNDFDEPTATVKGTWDALVINGADSASLASPAGAPSSPSSLLLSTPMVAAGVVYREQFTKYSAGGNSLSLQFALKIDAFDPSGRDVSLVRIGYRNNGWGVSLDLFGTTAQLLETVPQSNGGSQDIVHAVPQAPLGVWTVVKMSVDVVTNELSLSYDGEPVSIPNNTLTIPQIANAPFSVIVGANYLLGPLQPMKIYYDNVLIALN
ncbi:MAG TPA: hypothetical protein VN894_15690 [Polyangiaceae bacterium]|nr:hypothetical protein [Polyangiaceae bacterium]